jgi:anti-anti-sigma regulatory factor
VAEVPDDTSAEAAAAADAAEAAGVNLGDSLTIADVGELRERLRGELDLGGTLSIRAGEVEQLDAAGIQLLCAVARDARNQGLELAWDGVSARLESAVLQLGLQGEVALTIH